MRLQAVLLAAGAGRRFGGSKLTVDHGGRPLLTYALDSALRAPVQRVALVTGFHAEAVTAVAARHASADLASGRLALVHASDADEGMAASLRAGLKALSADYEGVFVFLGDMPSTPPLLPASMAEAFAASGVQAVAPIHDGQSGHPVLFGRALVTQLLQLKGDRGGRSVLAALGDACVRLDGFGAGVVEDRDYAAVAAPISCGSRST